MGGTARSEGAIAADNPSFLRPSANSGAGIQWPSTKEPYICVRYGPAANSPGPCFRRGDGRVDRGEVSGAVWRVGGREWILLLSLPKGAGMTLGGMTARGGNDGFGWEWRIAARIVTVSQGWLRSADGRCSRWDQRGVRRRRRWRGCGEIPCCSGSWRGGRGRARWRCHCRCR